MKTKRRDSDKMSSFLYFCSKPKAMLIHTHSGLRWIVLILIVASVFNAFSKWRFGKSYRKTDKLLNLFAMIFFHIQFLVGVILYFVSNKVQFGSQTMSNSMLRFFTVEHILMMTLAFILITMGRKRAESAEHDSTKHRRYFIWYGIVILIVLASIPWPFRTELSANWF